MCHIGLSHPNGLRKYTESFKHISRAMSVLDVGNNLNNHGKDAMYTTRCARHVVRRITLKLCVSNLEENTGQFTSSKPR